MARIKVRALVPFYDRAEDANREQGEEFEVTRKRLSELNACGAEQCFEPLVEEVKAEAEAEED